MCPSLHITFAERCEYDELKALGFLQRNRPAVFIGKNERLRRFFAAFSRRPCSSIKRKNLAPPRRAEALPRRHHRRVAHRAATSRKAHWDAFSSPSTWTPVSRKMGLALI